MLRARKEIVLPEPHPLVKSQQLCAALRTSPGFRFQVSLHHWINDHIREHEENLFCPDRSMVSSKACLSPEEMQTELEARSGHRQSLVSKAAFFPTN